MSGRPQPWLLPEDGIVDDVAIARAVSGESCPVAMTPAERELAIHGIISAGGGCVEVALALGTDPGHAGRFIRALGYRIIREQNTNVSMILGRAACLAPTGSPQGSACSASRSPTRSTPSGCTAFISGAAVPR
jgi:hypothetical protein